MTHPLPVLGASRPPADSWSGFLERRDSLVGRMEMTTCDGCDGCGLRCMDGFSVTGEEYLAVRDYLATLPPSEVTRVLGQGKTAPWPGAEDTGATVTYCRFRDRERNNCFVYPVRPTVCRLFGHTPWLPCPIGAVSRIPAGSPEVWNAYLSFEHKTWDEWTEELGLEGMQGPDVE